MLFATTGYTVGPSLTWIDRHLTGFAQLQVNLLAQIIPGVLAPGNPMANMVITVSIHGVEGCRVT